MNPTKTLACSAAALCFAAGAALASDPSPEDGDGLADYPALEDPDLIALYHDEEEDAATGAF
jgi:hypothetical protein